MARPHLDWQQLGSLQFSPRADQTGTLTEPAVSQPIMKFAYPATAASPTVPVNAAHSRRMSNHMRTAIFFPSSILNLKTVLKTFGRAKQCIQCPAPLFLVTVLMKDKKYDHNSIPRFIYSLCTSWILQQRRELLGPQVLCNAQAPTITFC